MLGIAVIGRAPRADVAGRFASATGTDVVLRGCLDAAPDSVLHASAEGLAEPLYTRLPCGRTATIDKADVMAGAPSAVARLRADAARTILFHCTGAFPPFAGSEGVDFPSTLLAALVSSLVPTASIGLFVPLREQVETLPAKWPRPERVHAVAVSPSAEPVVVSEAAERLAAKAPTIAVLDCMSYGEEAHTAARARLECPIILASRTVAAVLAELAR